MLDMNPVKRIGTAIFLAALPFEHALAQNGKCPSKVEAADGPAGYAYVEELNYCEGLYLANVSSDLRVVGYYDVSDDTPDILYKVTGEGGGAFELRALGREWANRVSSISIRGLSLDKGLLYLFDASIGPVSSVVWRPSKRLEAYMETSPEVGFYGFIEGEASPRYVPLSIAGVPPATVEKPALNASATVEAAAIALKIRTPDSLEGFSWEVRDSGRALIHEGWEDRPVQRNGVFEVMIPRGHGNVWVDVSADRLRGDQFIEKSFKAYSP